MEGASIYPTAVQNLLLAARGAWLWRRHYGLPQTRRTAAKKVAKDPRRRICGLHADAREAPKEVTAQCERPLEEFVFTDSWEVLPVGL